MRIFGKHLVDSPIDSKRTPLTGGASVTHVFFEFTVLRLGLSTAATRLPEGQVA